MSNQETIRDRVRRLLDEARNRKREQQRSVLAQEFQCVGYFWPEESNSNQENYICQFRLTTSEPSKSIVYLLVVNGRVMYVGESGRGIDRFGDYRYDTTEGQSKRVSDRIFDALLEGATVEVYAKEVPFEKSLRLRSESEYIELFETKRLGWNR